MCGITGFISTHSIRDGIIERMTETLIHRGPDGYGYYYGENVAFGHRRLSIVDLSEAGHQPMEYADRYVITYNGEIYNHVELRNELASLGCRFMSHTDTEVILAAYDRWGAQCLNRFNGMWAFVLYDRKEQTFFISRDRFGKKPLYYARTEDVFIFGSEIKAILAHPDIVTEPNVSFLNEYLQNGCKEYLNETSFEGIFRFPSSSYFIGSSEELFSRFEPKTFWELRPNLAREPFDETKAEEYAKRYYDLLEDAVRIRLRADVKVGSALSGGLDSSSIVYLVNKLLKEQEKSELQETFSSVYKSAGTGYCDESRFIDIIAQKLGVNSHRIEPSAADIPAEHEKMIYALENPPENTLMSSWYTFKSVASTDVKVTLDGQGADEQLAGYAYYFTSYLISLPFRDMLREAPECITVPGARKYVLAGIAMNIFKSLFGYASLRSFLSLLRRQAFTLDLNDQLFHDLTHSLQTYLHYADHTSMAFSIESRMPFMDYRIVEFLASVPAVYKMHNGWTKYLARLAFDGKLPDEVNWRRDKMGWPIPEKQWFSGSLSTWFASLSKLPAYANKLVFPSASTPDQEFAQKVRMLNVTVWKMKFFRDSKHT